MRMHPITEEVKAPKELAKCRDKCLQISLLIKSNHRKLETYRQVGVFRGYTPHYQYSVCDLRFSLSIITVYEVNILLLFPQSERLVAYTVNLFQLFLILITSFLCESYLLQFYHPHISFSVLLLIFLPKKFTSLSVILSALVSFSFSSMPLHPVQDCFKKYIMHRKIIGIGYLSMFCQEPPEFLRLFL